MITASAKSPHDAILSVSTKGPELAAIRMDNWKLIQLIEQDANADNSKASKKYDPISLYNLSEDPSESKNLAKIYPHKVLLMEIRLNQLLEGAVPAGKNIKGEE
jgi:arylsulfatase A-like enzyme